MRDLIFEVGSYCAWNCNVGKISEMTKSEEISI